MHTKRLPHILSTKPLCRAVVPARVLLFMLTGFASLFISVSTAVASSGDHPVVMTNDTLTLNKCGVTFLDPGGAGKYAEGTTTLQTLLPFNESLNVEVTFTFVELGENDTLMIFNGQDTSRAPIGKISGTAYGKSFNATKGSLTFVLISSAGTTGKGWKALIDCGIPLFDKPNPILFQPINDTILEAGFDNLVYALDEYFTDPGGDALLFKVKVVGSGVVAAEIKQSALMLTEQGSGTALIMVIAYSEKGGLAALTFQVQVDGNNDTSDSTVVKIPTEPILPIDSTHRADRNRPPNVVNPLSMVMAEQGFETDTITLSGVFTDPDGDSLVYMATSQNENALAVELDSMNLIITEKGTGASKIDILVTDGEYTTSTFFIYSITDSAQAYPDDRDDEDEDDEKENEKPEEGKDIDDIHLKVGFDSLYVDITDWFYDEDGDTRYWSVSSSDTLVAQAFILNDSTLLLTEQGTGKAKITITATDSTDTTCRSFHITVKEKVLLSIDEVPENIREEAGFGSDDLHLDDIFAYDEHDSLTFYANSSADTVATVDIKDDELIYTEVDTGSTTISVSATDGNDTLTTSFLLTIVESVDDEDNNKGKGKTIAELIAVIGNWFEYKIPDSLFLDAVATDSIIVNGLPAWLEFKNHELVGTPPENADNTTITIVFIISGKDGASSSINVNLRVEGVTWQNTLSHDGARLYPNPVTNRATLEVQPNWTGKIVTITDFRGRTVFRQLIEQEKTLVNLSDMNSGVYFLRIPHRSGSVVQRIIKR